MKKKSRLQKYHFYSTIFHYKSPRSSLKSRKPPHSPMLFFGNGKLWLHPKNIEHLLFLVSCIWKDSKVSDIPVFLAIQGKSYVPSLSHAGLKQVPAEQFKERMAFPPVFC